MENLIDLARQKGYPVGGLTVGQCIDLASEFGTHVSEVVIAEAVEVNKMTRQEVLSEI